MTDDRFVPSPHPYRAPRHVSPRRRAAAILSEQGVRMSMILATLLFLTVAVSTVYVSELAWYVVDWNAVYQNHLPLYLLLDSLVYVTDSVVILFTGIPLFYGWMRYMTLCSTGVCPPYSVLFCAFANRKSYARALAITILFVLRHLVPFALFTALILLALLLMNTLLSGLTVAGYALLILIALVAALLMILGVIRNAGIALIFILDINAPHLTVRQLLRRTKQLLQNKHSELWLLQLAFIPSLLLSIPTLGILLLLHVIPLHLLTVSRALCSLTGERLPVTDVAVKTENQK